MIDIFDEYESKIVGFDELISDKENGLSNYQPIVDLFKQLSLDNFKAMSELAKLSFLNQGVTYALYDKSGETIEQIFPFDLIPRIIPQNEWQQISEGVIQRNKALNMFMKDAYNEGNIFKEKIIPKELIFSSEHYCKQMVDFIPNGGIYNHISGTDIIRHSDGKYYVLEDNVRNPSGVSYVLTNRIAMKRVLSPLFNKSLVSPVDNYSEKLVQALWSVSGRELGDIFCVLLTPGVYNSAYYEHTFLAQKMGIELVEGNDLVVEDGFVYMKTIGGNIRVDVIYRRIDDAFIDPLAFRKDSMLGVAGLMECYINGNVTIVNAPGTGISDDKAVCSYVPEMIKFYLDEEAIIPNVPTYLCSRPKELDHVIENLATMVVKPVDMSGGYGVTICDELTKEELEEVKQKIQAKPRKYIAQPKIMLSTHATYIDEEEIFEPRHIDLRTYSIYGTNGQFVLNGGLTRTALVKNNLIVNSSQGGGSKDTWVLQNGR